MTRFAPQPTRTLSPFEAGRALADFHGFSENASTFLQQAGETIIAASQTLHAGSPEAARRHALDAVQLLILAMRGLP